MIALLLRGCKSRDWCSAGPQRYDRTRTRERRPMKLLRFGPPDREKPGLLDADGKIRDLSSVIDDVAGAALSASSLEKLRAIDPASLPLVELPVRLGPRVGRAARL